MDRSDRSRCAYEMFPWSAVFTLEPKVPGRSTEELVTNTLMLELGAMVKRTERIRLERATELQRASERRRHSNSADYSWLATPPAVQPYELTPQDLLELQGLCAKVPPAECGPCISKFRQMVTEIDPEVQEVPRLFRTVLQGCVEGEKDGEDIRLRVDKQRSKSLTHVNLRSRFPNSP